MTLEPEKESESHVAVLVSYAPIFALLKLIKRKKNGNSTIILSWHDYKRKVIFKEINFGCAFKAIKLLINEFKSLVF